MERDDESGFIYIGARYYCPWLARWLAPDPINSEMYNLHQGNPGRNTERQFVELTASSYEYCYANPVRFTDLSGEQATPEQNMAPRSWTDNAGNKYSLNETGEASVDGGTIKGAKGAGNSNPIRYTNVQLAPNKGPSASNGGQLSGANSESMGWAGLLLAGIELDVSILDPSDAFWPKWAGEAVLGIAAGIAIGLGVNEMTKPQTESVALPFSYPLDLPIDKINDIPNYYIHYTNKEGLAGILSTGAIFANKKDKVYLAKDFKSPEEVERDFFVGNPLYKGKGDYMVVFSVTPDQQANITRDIQTPLEYLYQGGGALRIKGELYYAGPNVTPKFK